MLQSGLDFQHLKSKKLLFKVWCFSTVLISSLGKFQGEETRDKELSVFLLVLTAKTIFVPLGL